MATFTWVEDKGTTAAVRPRVIEAKFGDGYSQRTQDGINTNLPEYRLRFSLLSQTDYDNILSFLESHAGVTAFDWTPFGRTQGKFLCSEWSHSFDFKGEISATFRKVPS